MLGLFARDQGDNEKARAFMDQSLALLRESGNTVLLWPVLNRIRLAVEEGDFVFAHSIAGEALSHAREAGSRSYTAGVLGQLGRMATNDGDYAAAKAFWDESLTVYWELAERHSIPDALEGLAALAAARGEPERAARLWGAAVALREALGQRPLDESRVAAVRAALGEEAFAVAWATGQTMSLEAAVEYALAGPEAALQHEG
jgi:tetratricopeptide (TPR) repeat protein